MVADVVIEKLKPIREEIHRLLEDRTHLHNVLREGTDTASCIASHTWKLVKDRIGIRVNVDK